MDIQKAITEIARSRPLPRTQRANYGQWVEPAWVVRGLVERGCGVTDAVNAVIAQMNLHPQRKAFNGVKAAYYALRHKPASQP